MLFKKNPSPRARPSHPTLANLREAEDTTITALPQPPTENDNKPPKEPLWRTLLAKLKEMWPFGKKEMVIGEPTDFRHVATGALLPSAGEDREVDSDWEDDE
jgi:hypothetical protein